MAASTRARVGVVVVGLAAAGLLVAGCESSPSAGPVGYEFVPSQSSGWSSGYEIFCNHGNRVYASSGGGLAVAPNDPSCKTP